MRSEYLKIHLHDHTNCTCITDCTHIVINKIKFHIHVITSTSHTHISATFFPLIKASEPHISDLCPSHQSRHMRCHTSGERRHHLTIIPGLTVNHFFFLHGLLLFLVILSSSPGLDHRARACDLVTPLQHRHTARLGSTGVHHL